MSDNSESSKHQFRISIKSILISTAFAAVTLAVVMSALESNAVVVASMELHARFWPDSSMVIELVFTGVAAAITIYLVASAQGRSGLRWGASVVLSITVRIVPETVDNLEWWYPRLRLRDLATEHLQPCRRYWNTCSMRWECPHISPFRA